MKRIETGNTSFASLITSNSIYVDKTEYIYRMIGTNLGSYFFLSRPVGFGKSLTVSTLEAIFKGKRDLFKGLYIDSTDYDWKEYPVISLDYGALHGNDVKELSESLNAMIKDAAREYEVDLGDYYHDDFGINLGQLLMELAKKNRAVVLINDFDKVLLENAYNPDLERFRYIVFHSLVLLKAFNAYTKFVFVTGVSEYTAVTWYSSANNFNDISKSRDYSSIMGYTIDEIEKYFAEYIDLGMKNTNLSRDEYMDRIRNHFKEYRFQCDIYSCLFGGYDEEDVEIVYNPTYIDRFFANGGYNFNIVEEDTPDEHFLKKRFRKLDDIYFERLKAGWESNDEKIESNLG